MSDLAIEETLTKLNTQLNKSMVLMDTTEQSNVYQTKRKSITINTTVQPISPSNLSPTKKKGILKKSNKKNIEGTEESTNDIILKSLSETNNARTSISGSSVTRPRNLKDLVQEEDLIVESTASTFSLEDLSDSEEIWIMDIPRTVDPMALKGNSIILGEKSKFKINEEKYCAVSHELKCNVTCVLKSNREETSYKTVNVKPAGSITIRRKLSNITKTKPIQIEDYGMPFPKNLKTRHPLFGVSYEGNVRKLQ